MPPNALDRAALEVLRRYPVSSSGDLIAMGNHGGFSGATLWRVAGRCLRAWPPDDSFPVRLDHIHHLMIQARAAGLQFVPIIEMTVEESSRVEHHGRWWELTEWLPGRADYRDHPSRARLESACTSLAQLHQVWSRGRDPVGPCPAVGRRLDGLRRWQDLLDKGWNPRAVVSESDPLYPLIGRTADGLARWLGSVPAWLLPWTTVEWQMQPCLCDVWHDHLLFEDDRLTGLIDYGSVKLDHVATDLARLLGSLVQDDDEAWCVGLAAYRAVRPFTAEEENLARVLDRTGTVLGVANWLRWLYAERRTFEDREGVAAR